MERDPNSINRAALVGAYVSRFVSSMIENMTLVGLVRDPTPTRPLVLQSRTGLCDFPGPRFEAVAVAKATSVKEKYGLRPGFD